MGGWVYIMASKRNGTLYTGVTSDLYRRVGEHKLGDISGFTSKYGCKMLVWYERHDDIEAALQREKSIKRYLRLWKLRLIESFNPGWDDLYATCQDRDNLFEPAFVKQFDDGLAHLLLTASRRSSSSASSYSSSSASGPRIQPAPSEQGKSPV
jgi:putative endonuclease